MHVFLYLVGATMIALGCLVLFQAPAITQEIAAVLLIGFGFLSLGLGGVIGVGVDLREELRRLNDRLAGGR